VVNSADVDAETWALALDGLRYYFTRFNDDITRNFAARYEFDLVKVNEGYGEQRFDWHYTPREMLRQFGPQKYPGDRPRGVFKVPKERVLEDNWNPPQNDEWAYRGMSWEEWKAIRKSGFIQSRGTHNIGQPGMTLFAEDGGTARHYATSFAPIGYQPGKRKPGVIIAVPREMTLPSNEKDWISGSGTTPKDQGLISAGERGVQGRLPLDVIQAVWYAIPTEGRGGSLELVHRLGSLYARQPWTEGSASGVDINWVLMQAYPERML
jgi:hypothetical protein